MIRPASAIVALGLRKSYGDNLVLDGVDLDVAEGTVFALLGPNGAGKTTIVQILSTLIGFDAGTVRVGGRDPARDPDGVRAAIGVTGQFSAVDNLLTGEENLILMADLHRLGRAEGRRRAARLLEQFDLVDAAKQPASTYSGGMRRRLDIAMTLVGDPRIIFLDEPTTGWTRAAAARCGRSSAGSSPAAPRSSSPRSTSRRPTSWPTGSRCSTTARSSPRARRRSSSSSSRRRACGRPTLDDVFLALTTDDTTPSPTRRRCCAATCATRCATRR